MQQHSTTGAIDVSLRIEQQRRRHRCAPPPHWRRSTRRLPTTANWRALHCFATMRRRHTPLACRSIALRSATRLLLRAVCGGVCFAFTHRTSSIVCSCSMFSSLFKISCTTKRSNVPLFCFDFLKWFCQLQHILTTCFCFHHCHSNCYPFAYLLHCLCFKPQITTIQQKKLTRLTIGIGFQTHAQRLQTQRH
jgi:hypothetical protein